MVTNWQYTCESIKKSIRTLRELIHVRDGCSECIRFTSDEIDEFILALCTGYDNDNDNDNENNFIKHKDSL